MEWWVMNMIDTLFFVYRPSDRNIMATNMHKKRMSVTPTYLHRIIRREDHHKKIKCPIHVCKYTTYTIWTPPSSPYQIEKTWLSKSKPSPQLFNLLQLHGLLTSHINDILQSLNTLLLLLLFCIKRIKAYHNISYQTIYYYIMHHEKIKWRRKSVHK